jgi:hypothetical protein
VVILSIVPSAALKVLSAVAPLLYYNHWPVSKFRDPSIKLLSRKNIVLSFEEIEYKETYVPDLSE